jgi:hypothetical protein
MTYPGARRATHELIVFHAGGKIGWSNERKINLGISSRVSQCRTAASKALMAAPAMNV